VMLKMIYFLNWKWNGLLLMLKGSMLKGNEKKRLQDWGHKQNLKGWKTNN
jgi:hypothetical protein